MRMISRPRSSSFLSGNTEPWSAADRKLWFHDHFMPEQESMRPQDDRNRGETVPKTDISRLEDPRSGESSITNLSNALSESCRAYLTQRGQVVQTIVRQEESNFVGWLATKTNA